MPPISSACIRWGEAYNVVHRVVNMMFSILFSKYKIYIKYLTQATIVFYSYTPASTLHLLIYYQYNSLCTYPTLYTIYIYTYSYLVLQHGHERVHVYAERVRQPVVVRYRATD